MSENATEKVALGPGARAAVDGDLSKSEVPDNVDPNATGVKKEDTTAATPAGSGSGSAAASSSSAAPSTPASTPAGTGG